MALHKVIQLILLQMCVVIKANGGPMNNILCDIFLLRAVCL